MVTTQAQQKPECPRDASAQAAGRARTEICWLYLLLLCFEEDDTSL
jgi:hypothetical protein